MIVVGEHAPRRPLQDSDEVDCLQVIVSILY
jgi:hypothetical protein